MRYEGSVFVKGGVREVFAFHANPGNAARVAPTWARVLRVDAEGVAAVGGRVRLRVAAFGLPQEWVVRWEIVEPPRGDPVRARLVDVAERSPFAVWRHEHEFAAEGTGTRMTDRVEWELPFGVAGRMAAPVAAWVLRRMFAWRHRATAARFGG